MTFLTGLIYPLLVTGIAQLALKGRADGSFIYDKEKIVGSELIGQKFEKNSYFWGRPSAVDYNPLPSGGSNLGWISRKLKQAVKERKEKIAGGVEQEKVPPELLYASGSGLDPHISASTAYYQVERIASTRKMESQKIKDLVDSMLTYQGYVNVLLLNIALDKLDKS